VPETFAVVAGGGTAGHVLPGIAIGQALVGRGHDPATIHFVGSERGIEARLVPEAGFGLTLLPGRGIQRRMTMANVAAVWGLLRAFASAFVLVARRKPRVVIALGGYASVPCALAAALLRVPIVVHEQNAVPGAANRLTARFAKASAVSVDGTSLPRAVVTGNPVRAALRDVDRAADRDAARNALGLPAGRAVVAAFGGSLGARRINVAVVDALSSWARRDDLALRHVVGERDWDLVQQRAPDLPDGGLVYQAVRYEDRMDLVLAACDLAVCRAGATTVSELSVLGVPSVLVPLPGAPGDHQTANARVLERAGAALLVPDAQLVADRLVVIVDELLGDPDRLAAMAKAAATVGRPDAAERVADLVEAHARG
jgi:UDP-N-acetylglucosamine--N-acetylmuramyl-(pentapeptide) pyrophosphoryl-undecaprenol N-acetylglucosamine transferase